jgi:hypothetical protein
VEIDKDDDDIMEGEVQNLRPKRMVSTTLEIHM